MADYNSSHTGEQIDAMASYEVYHKIAVGDLDWGNNNSALIDKTTLARWNGCTTGISSSLSNCNRGAFGTIVTANSPLPVGNGGTGTTAAGWTALHNLGLQYETVTLAFTNGYVQHSFGKDIYLLQVTAVGTDRPLGWSRTSGYSGYLFHFVHPSEVTDTATITVDVFYINK